MVNKKRLVDLTQRLIRINSENPTGSESRIAIFVRDYLKRFGLKTKIYEFKKQRSNVLAVLESRSGKHSLLLTPHLDTVPAGRNWNFAPFAGTVSRGRIYGLGATDCKGNLACGLEAIRSIVEEKVVLGYNLIFAATADEESGSKLGLIPLLDKGILRPDAAVVLDADEFNIIITQKGLIHLKIVIQGKKAHGAYPWQGINAIDIAVDMLQKLKAHKFTPLEKSRCVRKSSLTGFTYTKNKYLKAPTLNIGTIKGGDKVNIVADWCEFELDCRFLPGMSEKKILEDIRGIARRYTRNFKIEIEGIQKPYFINEKHRLVHRLTQAMKKTDIKPKIKGSEGATVITFFQDKGIPAIATGFGCEGCGHTRDEYVRIDNLYRGALVLEEFIKNYQFIPLEKTVHKTKKVL